MKAVIATPNWPVEPGSSSGTLIRLGQYVRLARDLGATAIRMVHFMPRAAMAALPEPAALSRQQSDHWGVEVEARVIPFAERRETVWNHYVRGFWDAASQLPQFRYAGPEQGRMMREAAEGADLFVSRYFVPMLALRRGGGPRPRAVVMDFDDPDHLARWRKGRAQGGPGGLLYRLQVPALIAAGRRAAAYADLTLVCSRKECLDLRRLGFPRVDFVNSSNPAPADPPGLVAEPTLLFLGTLDYPPNAEGAERLVSRIFPLVRREVPDARLIVAGRKPEEVPSFARRPEGVEWTGFVPDLAALYARSRVVVCPLVMGTGVRAKLIEAGGYARPMVSTALGAEGLAFGAGRDIVIRESDADFAAACVALLRDGAECARLGAAARETFLREYDERASMARFRELVGGLLGR